MAQTKTSIIHDTFRKIIRGNEKQYYDDFLIKKTYNCDSIVWICYKNLNVLGLEIDISKNDSMYFMFQKILKNAHNYILLIKTSNDDSPPFALRPDFDFIAEQPKLIPYSKINSETTISETIIFNIEGEINKLYFSLNDYKLNRSSMKISLSPTIKKSIIEQFEFENNISLDIKFPFSDIFRTITTENQTNISKYKTEEYRKFLIDAFLYRTYHELKQVDGVQTISIFLSKFGCNKEDLQLQSYPFSGITSKQYMESLDDAITTFMGNIVPVNLENINDPNIFQSHFTSEFRKQHDSFIFDIEYKNNDMKKSKHFKYKFGNNLSDVYVHPDIKFNPIENIQTLLSVDKYFLNIYRFENSSIYSERTQLLAAFISQQLKTILLPFTENEKDSEILSKLFIKTKSSSNNYFELETNFPSKLNFDDISADLSLKKEDLISMQTSPKSKQYMSFPNFVFYLTSKEETILMSYNIQNRIHKNNSYSLLLNPNGYLFDRNNKIIRSVVNFINSDKFKKELCSITKSNPVKFDFSKQTTGLNKMLQNKNLSLEHCIIKYRYAYPKERK